MFRIWYEGNAFLGVNKAFIDVGQVLLIERDHFGLSRAQLYRQYLRGFFPESEKLEVGSYA